jgi:hypothetical protein
MYPNQVSCPRCRAVLSSPQPIQPGSRLRCPKCGGAFTSDAITANPPVLAAIVAAGPRVPPPLPPDGGGPPWDGRRAGPGSNALAISLVAGGILLFVGGGVLVLVLILSGGSGGDNKVADGGSRDDNQVADGKPHQDKPSGDKPADKDQGPKPKPKPVRRALTALPPAEQKKVDQAIERGVAYLRAALDEASPQGKDEVRTVIGPVGIKHGGARALVGLTLLACGVKADDPALQKVITSTRAEAEEFTNTYTLALAILFLDRLADPQDKPLVQRLAMRLVAGQNLSGGWSYGCPKLTLDEQRDLLTLTEALTKAGNQPLQGHDALLARYRNVPVVAYQPGQNLDDTRVQTTPVPIVHSTAYSDNSTTQFAILALWAAQKYGISVDRNLVMVEKRFRTMQNADGSWGYYNVDKRLWLDSMTCAGLLGLATGRGAQLNKVQGEEKDLTKDPQVDSALRYLSNVIGKPKLAAKRPFNGLHYEGNLFGSTAEEDLFLLWAIERVAVIYDLRTINGKEWYPWGAKLLVEVQRADGGWFELYGTVPNTCFALLFLKRANVAEDLTSKLKLGN